MKSAFLMQRKADMTFLQALWLSTKIFIVGSLLVGAGLGGIHLMFTLFGSMGLFICFVFLIILVVAGFIYEESN